MSDLKERLRAATSTHHCVSTEGEGYATIERIHLPPAIQVEAADCIERLERENAALRALLSEALDDSGNWLDIDLQQRMEVALNQSHQT